ncbi:MAG: phosphatase PAP2 family protein [Thermodesulfobacteriota bacterium]
MDVKRLLHPQADYNVWRKMFILAGVVAFYTLGYMYLNYTTINSERFYDVSFEFEKRIPFYYQLVWSYIFVYFLVIVMFLTINSDALLNEAVKTFMVCMGIHFLFFYFMPVKMVDRPVLVPNGNLWHDYAAFWYWVDEPTTLFPSAHVSMSFCSAYYTRRVNKRLGDFCLLVAAYVAVSVVLIKQHYVADVLAGFILASSTYLFFSHGYDVKIRTRIPRMQMS